MTNTHMRQNMRQDLIKRGLAIANSPRTKTPPTLCLSSKVIGYSMVLILLAFSVSAQAILVGHQGRLLNNTNGTAMKGTFDINVTYYKLSDNSAVYTENVTMTIGASGVFDYLVGMRYEINPIIFKDRLYAKTKIDETQMSGVNITFVPYSIYTLLANNTDYFNGQAASYYATVSQLDSLGNNVTLLQTTVANIATNQTNLTTLINNITRRIDALNGSIGTGSGTADSITTNLNENITLANNSVWARVAAQGYLTSITDIWSINDSQIVAQIAKINTSISNLASNQTNTSYRMYVMNQSILALAGSSGASAADVTYLNSTLNSAITNLQANITSNNETLWARVVAQGYLTSVTDIWSSNDTSILTQITSINTSISNLASNQTNTSYRMYIMNQSIAALAGSSGASANDITYLNATIQSVNTTTVMLYTNTSGIYRNSTSIIIQGTNSMLVIS